VVLQPQDTGALDGLELVVRWQGDVEVDRHDAREGPLDSSSANAGSGGVGDGGHGVTPVTLLTVVIDGLPSEAPRG
jgi:hypothetical protein